QVGLIYTFSALAKWGPTWRDGTAIHYALHCDQFSRPLGTWMGNLPVAITRVLTQGTWLLEAAALPMIVSPLGQPWFRRGALIGLSLLQVGIGLTMRIGTFSATMLVSHLLLVSDRDWQWRPTRRFVARTAAAVPV